MNDKHREVKKVDQKIELGYGVDFKKLVEDIRRLTEEKNKEGYELTDVSTQINNGKTTMSSLAVLVYTNLNRFPFLNER